MSENHSNINVASYDDKINWIRLARSRNVNINLVFSLLKTFGNIGDVLNNITKYSLKSNLKKEVILYPHDKAQKELENSHKIGADIICFNEAKYPKLLREIYSPPLILTFRGNIELINKNIIAIVGTRNASFNGLKFAEKISYEIGLNNIITVSGLARGIDTAAHKASLNSGTIGVIAGGIDNIYPKENSNLYEEIINKGLLITENPLGAAPKSMNFPRRNRIISGLALGLVVVEATLRSGTLISARFALEQNREVFAVPGSPFDPRYEGTNNLIKQGAKLTQNSEDVLEEITKLSEYKTNLEASASDLSSNLPLESPIIYDDPRPTKTTSNSSGIKLDSKKDVPKKELFNDQKIRNIEELILSKINYTPISREILINELEISAKTANEVLLELELVDKIINENGKISLKS